MASIIDARIKRIGFLLQKNAGLSVDVNLFAGVEHFSCPWGGIVIMLRHIDDDFFGYPFILAALLVAL